MSKTLKLIVAVMITLGVVIVARASLLSVNYLPIVNNSYPLQPSATPTVTPTPTQTPTPTKTPDTPCLSLKTSGVCITKIDFDPSNPMNEFIRLQNVSSGKSYDIKNWRISSDSGNKFDIPSFTLGGDKTVEIWTKSGDNDSDDLFMDREEEFWNNKSDCAYVMNDDDSREKIDGWCYRVEDDLTVIWFPPPATAP